MIKTYFFQYLKLEDCLKVDDKAKSIKVIS